MAGSTEPFRNRDGRPSSHTNNPAAQRRPAGGSSQVLLPGQAPWKVEGQGCSPAKAAASGRGPHLPIPGHRAQPPCPPLTPQVQLHLSPVGRTVPVLSPEACKQGQMVQISYSSRAHPNPMGPSLNEKVCPAQHLLPVSSAVTEAVPTQPPQTEPPKLRVSGLQTDGGHKPRWRTALVQGPSYHLVAHSSWPRQVLPWLRPPGVTHMRVAQPPRSKSSPAPLRSTENPLRVR